jgi:hypothetical protein
MFETTEYGIAFTTMTVIRNTGNAAGIVDTDFLTPAEIRAALSQKDPETSRILEAFLEAFRTWYQITTLIQGHLHQDRTLGDEHMLASENRKLRSIELQERLRILNCG